MTLREALTHAAATISRRDAETLLAHTLGCDRAFLRAHSEDPIPAPLLATFQAHTARRAAHEPVQYITGHQEFYGIDLRVTPDVLIPRPETEILVEAVLLWSTRFHDERTLRIADIGTGSGAIAIALATHLAGATFLATDISPAALALARSNAETHGCDDRITFVHADLLTPQPSVTSQHDQSPASTHPPFDCIVSNPPYVPLADLPTLHPEVADHEPHTALFAAEDGLALYRRLIPAAHAALVPGGLLALELGFGQRDALAALLAGWNHVRFLPDLQGIPRTALAERP